MKRVYAWSGGGFVMLALSLLTFMATVPVGNGFYDRKKTQYLKTIHIRRGTFKWVTGSVSGDHPANQRPLDTTNIKRVKLTNGFPITAGFRRKRNITLADSSSSRTKRRRGKVQTGSSMLKFQCKII